MATVIAAISGGVDSVVLLHLLAKHRELLGTSPRSQPYQLVVAHVDHGIRKDSAADARFVQTLSQYYGCIYEEKQLSLGIHTSENRAREGRYDFLFHLAKKYQATIATAHHGDDLAETIAINLQRGTGWRGLAVLNRRGVIRPLLGYSKAELYAYALTHHLEWVEDDTNRNIRYLRNRVRRLLAPRLTEPARQRLLELRDQQVAVAQEIAAEEQTLLRGSVSRYLLTHISQAAALELLGSCIYQHVGIRPTRPQLQRALLAVKTAKPGTVHQVGAGITLQFSTRFFSVEMV